MNPLNYASLEASKRLVEAGIVLETDFMWWNYDRENGWALAKSRDNKEKGLRLPIGIVPAPSMAEVWRELPDRICIEKHIAFTQANYPTGELYTNKIFCNTNPTDALIDLLIWVTEQRKEKP